MKYLILGGGPAGLSVACRLLEKGETSFLVLESEKEAGGLCRSQNVGGSPMDIGGGHFLDVRNTKVNDFLFQYMGREEWSVFERDSRIALADGTEINHPIEANIWQMEENKQRLYLESIKCAGCNTGEKKPEMFVEWIKWKLGERIALDYMLPYNQKMFGDNLDELGTYWLNKLPDVSYDEIMKSCKQKRAFGRQPGHARFFYPDKYGYGELWRRMAERLGEHVLYCEKVVSVNVSEKKITTPNGIYEADTVITSIPWGDVDSYEGVPGEIMEIVRGLRYTSVQTEYVDENLNSEAHWIYYPDLNLPYHRILLRHNFLPGSRGYWTETTGNRAVRGAKNSFWNEYAYPLNIVKKNEKMEYLLEWFKKKNIVGIGRWGEHQHYNSDVVVEKALKLVDEML